MAPLQAFAPARNRDFISALMLIANLPLVPAGSSTRGIAASAPWSAIGQQRMMLLNHDAQPACTEKIV